MIHTETNNLTDVNTMKYVKYFIEEMNGFADIQVDFSGMSERRNHDLSEKIKDIYERLKRFCNSFLFVDNSNVDENSVYTTVLRKKKLSHLSKYDKSLCSYTNDTDITKHLSTANTDISQILKELCSSNPKNVIMS